MPEDERRESHRVAFELMHIGSTNPAALHVDEHLVSGDFPDGKLAHLDPALACEHSRAA